MTEKELAQSKKIMQTFKDDTPKTTGERLSYWRKIRGYTQEEFVDATGAWKDTTTYSKIERNKVKLTDEKAEKCAVVLGVTKEYLLCKDQNATFLHSIYDNLITWADDRIKHENRMIIEGKILEILGIQWDVPQNENGQFIPGDITVRFDDGSSFLINERQNQFLHVLVHDSLITLHDTIQNYCITSTKVLTKPKEGDADD